MSKSKVSTLPASNQGVSLFSETESDSDSRLKRHIFPNLLVIVEGTTVLYFPRPSSMG